MPSQRVLDHCIVYYDAGNWAAVAANNGGNGPIWQWGDELLIGFTVGAFKKTEQGHQVSNDDPYASWLARSVDGGGTWKTWAPDGYAGQPAEVAPHVGEVDFTGPGFVMRVEGNGYHGNAGSHWFCSEDRGETWRGPLGFGDLLSHADLEDNEFTGRTAYLVEGPGEMLIFLSTRERGVPKGLNVSIREKTFVARTTDGGRNFELVSWVVPRSDPDRAVMTAPVRISPSELVVALRRRSQTNNWIDCHGSADNGLTWSFLSKVGDTEAASSFNGNPPAMIRLTDGRLCCVYGNRSDRQIVARTSGDGTSWTDPLVLRSDFESVNGWPDLGYPRLFERTDGKLVTAYFWCTPERPHTHIEATIFDAP